MTHTLHLGDAVGVLQFYPDNHFDSCVTDSPYGLAFMNKAWDYDVPSVEIWKEVYRVLKPGAHLLNFSSARTYHRMVVNVEDAGFEIRDQIMWVYGSGFPKSHNIGKAVDKISDNTDYEGWGTGLKPAHEPIVLARKPISEKTIALNVLKWGTGGLNIDASRVGTEPVTINTFDNGAKPFGDAVGEPFTSRQSEGRFPANFIHDGSQQVLDLFPTTKSGKMGPEHNRTTDGSPNGIYGKFDVNHPLSETYGDEGSAARFFYCAKASKKERNAGCENLPDKEWKHHKCSNAAEDGIHNANGQGTIAGVSKNNHPTIKPQALMTYLINLVTPPGGLVLDPFMGSGSTGVAALSLSMGSQSSPNDNSVTNNYSFVGVELDKDYLEIATHRINNESTLS